LKKAGRYNFHPQGHSALMCVWTATPPRCTEIQLECVILVMLNNTLLLRIPGYATDALLQLAARVDEEEVEHDDTAASHPYKGKAVTSNECQVGRK